MTSTKTLFVAALLTAVSAVSFAQTPAVTKESAIAPKTLTAPAGTTVDTTAPVQKKHHAHKHDSKKVAAPAADAVVAK